MKYYKFSVSDSQWFMPKNEDESMEVVFDCTKKEEEWKKLKMFVFDPKSPRCNFNTVGNGGTLLFDRKVYDSDLYDLLESAGEILPVDVEGETFFLLNILVCVNALDDESSTYNTTRGRKGRLISPALYDNRMTESSIFKIPETCKTEMYCYSGVKDADLEFKYLYEKLGFTGLEFQAMESL